MSSPVMLTGDQLAQLAQLVAGMTVPPGAGDGFANPVSSVFQAGNTTLITAAGLFVYSGTPAAGNLLLASAPAAGTDPWGNPYDQSETLIALAGLTSLFTVTDTSGNTLAGIDSGGNITGATVNAGTDVILGGQSLAGYMASAPAGVIARGWTPGSSAAPWPAAALNAAASCTALLELDFTAAAGRDYLLQVLPATVLFSTAPSANAQYVQRLFCTTDGSTPGFTGSGTPAGTTTEVSGHSPGITPVLASTTANYPTPYQEYVLPVPAAATAWRFLLAAYCTGSAYGFQFSNSLEMRVTDLGAGTGQFSNAGAVLGAGKTGGSGGTQTFTETFYPAATYSYYNTTGLRDTDGSMYHGSPNAGGSYWEYAYIGWGTGSLGHTLPQLLAGYTVNSAALRLTCVKSWYSNGFRFGLHTGVAGGSPGYSAILNTGGWFIGEGATSSYPLTAAQWSALMAAGVYTVLAPDAADDYALTWYGVFYGGVGGNSSYWPRLTVTYTT